MACGFLTSNKLATFHIVSISHVSVKLSNKIFTFLFSLWLKLSQYLYISIFFTHTKQQFGLNFKLLITQNYIKFQLQTNSVLFVSHSYWQFQLLIIYIFFKVNNFISDLSQLNSQSNQVMLFREIRCWKFQNQKPRLGIRNIVVFCNDKNKNKLWYKFDYHKMCENVV